MQNPRATTAEKSAISLENALHQETRTTLVVVATFSAIIARVMVTSPATALNRVITKGQRFGVLTPFMKIPIGFHIYTQVLNYARLL
uniref:Sideroflexin-4 n=1 Tax=Echinococcus granulosus TaxID=6210 RepID=A0A068WFV1_ECHGR|nr:hypothetical protein EgrG_000891500 [Echinococcus granulosus]